MKLHQTQAEIALDKHRFRVLCCGRRWGKTTLAGEEIKGFVLKGNKRIAYIAPTYQQARDIAWQMLLKELKPKKPNESRLEFKINGSLIQLRGWEAVETLRGQHFDFIVIDEVAMMRNFWMNWEEVISPTLTDTKGQVMFISTPKGFNHFYDLFNKQDTDKDFKSFKFSSYENPHLPAEELDRQKQSLPEDRFAQEFLADFRKTQGLVYKQFDRERHITPKQPTAIARVMSGIDWGHTNPAAAYRVREDNDRHYWIDSEFYKTRQSTEQIIEAVKLMKPELVYPDPAEPDRLEMARRAGLNVREVSKDIEAGIDTVQELLKQNRIHISPNCKNLIWEFETYRYPDKKPDQNEKETPIKENDHGLDAIRYCLHNQTPIIEEYEDPYFNQYGTAYRET